MNPVLSVLLLVCYTQAYHYDPQYPYKVNIVLFYPICLSYFMTCHWMRLVEQELPTPPEHWYLWGSRCSVSVD